MRIKFVIFNKIHSVSHTEERKEKKCLNCNAVVHGRYCGICGQENLEPQETVWHLVSHFFNDLTHFDGKFFSTVKWLILKPGFLTQEYVNGRRGSYLNPVRMYFFTSAFFFLVYFSFFSPADQKHSPPPTPLSRIDSFNIFWSPEVVSSPVLDKTDSFYIKSGLAPFFIDTTKKNHPSEINAKAAKPKEVKPGGNSITQNNFRDRKQYDSLIKAGIVKDDFLKRLLRHKQFSINEKYGSDSNRIQDQLVENIKHNVPLMFFLSLPLIALFLKLIYIRRKKFYYVAHVIFTLHMYIYIYVAVLVMLIIDVLSDLNYLSWLEWLLWIFIPLTFLYPYRAMRNFYGQGRGKTVIKFILLLTWLTFILMLLLLVMLLFSVFKL